MIFLTDSIGTPRLNIYFHVSQWLCTRLDGISLGVDDIVLQLDGILVELDDTVPQLDGNRTIRMIFYSN
ncbi:hypothetical protein J2S77_002620 [Alkalibacillus salilacus]|uniref:DUF2642 domain-containing protein n=1 Tax=Alkalibacillus salilacus TaxID=284582 RepID=A0ABT9VI20_9BACI|nr:hypothetical protein [Alkalibacillus salilacus]